jgi:lysophosphatidate acyltransferase
MHANSTPTAVLDPIPTTDLTPADVDELTRGTRELMLSELIALTVKARGFPVAVPATNGSSKGKSTAIDN